MKDRSLELGSVDYALSAMATISVLLSAGYSVRNDQAGYLFAVIALIGHIVAFFAPRPGVAHRITPDTAAFAALAAGSIAFAGQLNALLPDGGFPPQLMYTAGLCWAICLGCFLAWRDSTLLFLGVPAIALYGLVGAFDTFPYAPFMFFVFLVTVGMLFARSHLRGMLRMASHAGEGDLYRLRRYAWKSLAGPEWALASALGIVVFSALGAPFIRNSVQMATAPLRVPIRNNPIAPNNPSPNAGLGSPNPNRESLRVGSGPFGRPSRNTVLHAKMDKAHYLRGEAYYLFSENRWRTTMMGLAAVTKNSDGAINVATPNEEAQIPGLNEFGFEVTAVGGSLPGPYFPGIPSQLRGLNSRNMAMRIDGIVRTPPGGMGPSVSGISYEPNLSLAKQAVEPSWWRAAYNMQRTSGRAQALVNKTIRGLESDYDKAEALRALVSRTITYNLQAPVVPDEADVVDSALFGNKQGYCDVFATTLAMLLRYAGLPTRVASGYLVSEGSRGRGGYYRVRESDYHIWTEVYFQDAGWVTFDATDGAREVDGFGRGEPWRAAPPWWHGGWVSMATNAFMVLCLLGIAGAVFWDAIRKRTRTPGFRFVRSEREVLAAETLESLERNSKVPRKFSETTSEYASRLEKMFPDVPLSGLAQALDQLLFAPASTEVPNLEMWRAAIGQMKGTI